MVGITCIYNILESIDSPFDEKGMDDVRITTDTLQFKNDINLLTLHSEVTQTYKQQQDLDKNSKVIFVRKKKTCNVHVKHENNKIDDDPRICHQDDDDEFAIVYINPEITISTEKHIYDELLQIPSSSNKRNKIFETKNNDVCDSNRSFTE